jgi:AcrR family transcriptional regulator
VTAAPGRPAATRLPAPARRRQLLEVARELFAARGFHATAMDDVAEAAGVTKPVLYQHFASKRALYVELLEDVGARLLEALAAATGGVGSRREQVEHGFAAYFRFVAANRAAFRLLFGASVRNDAEFSAVAQAVIEQIADAVTGLIALEGVTAEQRRIVAHGLTGMAEATGRLAVADGTDASPEQLAAWLAEFAWYGLRGIRPRP